MRRRGIRVRVLAARQKQRATEREKERELQRNGYPPTAEKGVCVCYGFTLGPGGH